MRRSRSVLPLQRRTPYEKNPTHPWKPSTEGNEVNEVVLEGGALRRLTRSPFQRCGLAGARPSVRLQNLGFLRCLLFHLDLPRLCLRDELCTNAGQRRRARSAAAAGCNTTGRSRAGAGQDRDESEELHSRERRIQNSSRVFARFSRLWESARRSCGRILQKRRRVGASAYCAGRLRGSRSDPEPGFKQSLQPELP